MTCRHWNTDFSVFCVCVYVFFRNINTKHKKHRFFMFLCFRNIKKHRFVYVFCVFETQRNSDFLCLKHTKTQIFYVFSIKNQYFLFKTKKLKFYMFFCVFKHKKTQIFYVWKHKKHIIIYVFKFAPNNLFSQNITSKF